MGGCRGKERLFAAEIGRDEMKSLRFLFLTLVLFLHLACWKTAMDLLNRRKRE